MVAKGIVIARLPRVRAHPGYGSCEALTFLKDWFLQHVLGTDKKFEEWLRRSGDRDVRQEQPTPSRGS